jgi:hypothetical protein
MSSIITCREQFVWKYGVGSDDSFLGLYQVPEIVGVGKHHTVVFDEEELLNSGKTIWVEVDPMQSEVQGEVLIIEPSEIEKIQDYINTNLPKLSLWQKFLGRRIKPNSFLQMLHSLLAHVSKENDSEFILAFA